MPIFLFFLTFSPPSLQESPYVGAVSPPTAPAPAAKDGKAAPDAKAEPKQLIRSMFSFKVLTECPILIVLLFQLYAKFSQTHLPQFVPLIIGALKLQAEAQERMHRENPHSVGVSPAVQDKVAYGDFIGTQVKVRRGEGEKEN